MIACGASTRQVARTLGITTKTAGIHIERIYIKTGASTRSTITLFALEHGLLDSLSLALEHGLLDSLNPVDLQGDPRRRAPTLPLAWCSWGQPWPRQGGRTPCRVRLSSA